MEKTCFVLLAVCLVLASAAPEGFHEEFNIWELDKNSFWKIAHKIHKHVVIELYSSESWCFHCRNLHPVFRAVAKKYKNEDDILFARMDLSTFKPIDLHVIGYPSIKVFRRGNEEVDYWGDNNEIDITDFIETSVLRKAAEL